MGVEVSLEHLRLINEARQLLLGRQPKLCRRPLDTLVVNERQIQYDRLRIGVEDRYPPLPSFSIISG
jgi:hypothetical protein